MGRRAYHPQAVQGCCSRIGKQDGSDRLGSLVTRRSVQSTYALIEIVHTLIVDQKIGEVQGDVMANGQTGIGKTRIVESLRISAMI